MSGFPPLPPELAPCFVVPESVLEAAKKLHNSWLREGALPGRSLLKVGVPSPSLSGNALALATLRALLKTRRPQVFAENLGYGPEEAWTREEMSLLGEVSFALEVEVFDDGRHQFPKLHPTPFSGCLVFVPGPLLASPGGQAPVDEAQVRSFFRFSETKAKELFQRRLRPALFECARRAQARGRPTLVTAPGIGCGVFAGRYRDSLPQILAQALLEILEESGPALEGILGIRFDPYRALEDRDLKTAKPFLRVRPLEKGRRGRPQLSKLSEFEEAPGEFQAATLTSLVAWDPVSWPGNDFWAGSRATDDGVKGAATDALGRCLDVPGTYDPEKFGYQPPDSSPNWRDFARTHGLGFATDSFSIRSFDRLGKLETHPGVLRG